MPNTSKFSIISSLQYKKLSHEGTAYLDAAESGDKITTNITTIVQSFWVEADDGNRTYYAAYMHFQFEKDSSYEDINSVINQLVTDLGLVFAKKEWGETIIINLPELQEENSKEESTLIIDIQQIIYKTYPSDAFPLSLHLDNGKLILTPNSIDQHVKLKRKVDGASLESPASLAPENKRVCKEQVNVTPPNSSSPMSNSLTFFPSLKVESTQQTVSTSQSPLHEIISDLAMKAIYNKTANMFISEYETFEGKNVVDDDIEKVRQFIVKHSSSQSISSTTNQFDFLNTQDLLGNIPLHLAVSNLTAGIVNYLITDDNINMPDLGGRTPLKIAIETGATPFKMQVLKSLIEKGAVLTTEEENGDVNSNMPLTLANALIAFNQTLAPLTGAQRYTPQQIEDLVQFEKNVVLRKLFKDKKHRLSWLPPAIEEEQMSLLNANTNDEAEQTDSNANDPVESIANSLFSDTQQLAPSHSYDSDPEMLHAANGMLIEVDSETEDSSIGLGYES